MVDIYISYFKQQPIVCLSIFITLIPLILIVRKRAYIDSAFLLMFIYLIFKLIVDNLMLYYAAIKVNTVIYFNVNVLVRYIFLSGMFFYKLETPHLKKYIVYSMWVFAFFCICDFIYINPNLDNLHDHKALLYSTTLECLLMIFWILLYFYETIRSLKISNLLSFPFFWVCSGLLLYYSSFVFIAPVLHNAFTWDQRLDIGFLLYIPYIFEIVSMILFSVGIGVFSASQYAKQ
jgi:hypothetical protein